MQSSCITTSSNTGYDCLKMDDVMSRYACNLYKKLLFGKKRLVDDNCIIGYDEAMQTYFFQSGQENEFEEPILWLGTNFQEYKLLSEIEKTLERNKLILIIEQEDRKKLQNFA